MGLEDVGGWVVLAFYASLGLVLCTGWE